MKKTAIILFLTLVQFIALSQIKFKITVGGTFNDYGRCIIETHDKFYITIGSTGSFGAGNSDMFYVKCDSLGTTVLTKTIGSPKIEQAYSIAETFDKNLIIAGYTNNTVSNGYDIYLVKSTENGEKMWEKTYGGTDWDFGYSVKQTPDSGFIIGGTTYSFGNGNADMYLIKTNKYGDTVWTHTYGGTEDDELNAVKPTSDGGYILTGYTKSLGDIDGDVYVIKTNATGDTLWTKKYGSTASDIGHDIVERINGGYIIGGETQSFGNTKTGSYILRINSMGDTIWTRSFGGSSQKQIIYSLVEEADSTIAFTGVIDLYLGGEMEGKFARLDADGNLTGAWSAFWGTTFGTSGNAELYSISLTHDKGYIMCGYTDTIYSGFGSYPNIFILKLDSNESKPSGKFYTSVPTQVSGSISTTAYPNPINQNETFTLESNKALDEYARLEITDLLGRDVTHLFITIRTDKNKYSIRPTSATKGIYTISIIENNIIGRVKVSVLN